MISSQQLDQLEKSRQKDSDWVLSKLNLISKLQKYGEVKIAGAKALGLMIAKDIDISVIVKEVKIQDWQKLVQELMAAPYVRNVSAIDYYNYDEQNRYDPANGQKYSLYIGINNIMGPEGDKHKTWECQIHLIEPSAFGETKITGVKSRLIDKKRLTILQLKYWADEVNKVLRSITCGNYKILSPFIYEAVLDKNIETIPDFLSWFTPQVPEKFREDFEIALKQQKN